MIYTVTFNPSLDYIVRVNNFRPGVINRTFYEKILPGGKGINVSIVLSSLGHDSIALGFMAGFTGEDIEELLKGFGCGTDFIRVKEGFSRINVKMRSDEETEINGQGPLITEEDIGLLYEKLDHLVSGDILVISGSVPGTLPQDVYERIMERLQGRKGPSHQGTALWPLADQTQQPRARRDLWRHSPHTGRSGPLCEEAPGGRREECPGLYGRRRSCLSL